MVTAAQCSKKYGDPYLLKTQQTHFEVWEVPNHIQDAFAHVRFTAVGTIGFPKKIFINKDFKPILEKALNNVIENCLTLQIKTWDGCFIIRNKRGGTTLSLHSWAIACDINAQENRLGAKPKITKQLVKCFTDAGCEWGGGWKRPDGMHFQMAKLN
jgi:hypothetical protein